MVLNPAAVRGVTFLRKAAMQLASKMRFVSAQFEALLAGDLWLRNASHANAMARRLAAAVARRPRRARSTRPVQANAVFARAAARRDRAAAEAVPLLRLGRAHRRGALDVRLRHHRGGRRRVRGGRRRRDGRRPDPHVPRLGPPADRRRPALPPITEGRALSVCRAAADRVLAVASKMDATWTQPRPSHPSAATRAYDHLKRAILEGTHPGGTLLTEGEVAERLGVSRTPVREALLRLEAEGLVRLYPKKGALVVPVSAQEAHDVVEARALIEEWAAGRAWPRRARSPRSWSCCWRRCAGPARADAFLDFTAADRAFHERVVAAAGNDAPDPLLPRAARAAAVHLHRGDAHVPAPDGRARCAATSSCWRRCAARTRRSSSPSPVSPPRRRPRRWRGWAGEPRRRPRTGAGRPDPGPPASAVAGPGPSGRRPSRSTSSRSSTAPRSASPGSSPPSASTSAGPAVDVHHGPAVRLRRRCRSRSGRCSTAFGSKRHAASGRHPDDRGPARLRVRRHVRRRASWPGSSSAWATRWSSSACCASWPCGSRRRRTPMVTQLTGLLGQLGALVAAGPLALRPAPLGLDPVLRRRRARRGASSGVVLVLVVARLARTPTTTATSSRSGPSPARCGRPGASRAPGSGCGRTSPRSSAPTCSRLLWGFPFLVAGQGLSAGDGQHAAHAHDGHHGRHQPAHRRVRHAVPVLALHADALDRRARS